MGETSSGFGDGGCLGSIVPTWLTNVLWLEEHRSESAKTAQLADFNLSSVFSLRSQALGKRSEIWHRFAGFLRKRQRIAIRHPRFESGRGLLSHRLENSRSRNISLAFLGFAAPIPGFARFFAEIHEARAPRKIAC